MIGTGRLVSPIFLGLTALLLAGPAMAQVQGVLGVNNDRLQGTNLDGYLRLYAPDPVERGSSVSHWDTSPSPNLLMEPSINSDLGFLELDLTPNQMEDIGWNRGSSGFNVINLDPPGVGFTDPTPFPGAPGNPATTLGEARINVFNEVLSAWANTLDSPVVIDIEVTWQPLSCGAGGAALAGAQTIFIFRDFDTGIPETWYHSALAEALTGQDLSREGEFDDNDIFIVVNPDIDDECLPGITGFYYGLDGQNPLDQIDLAPVVLHEVGHGLGFANFTDERDGVLADGFPGIYDRFTFDTDLGKTWAQMTDAERVASAVNTGGLVWNGPEVTSSTADFLNPGVPELLISSPAEIAGIYEIGAANFGPPLPDTGIAGEITCMTDGTSLGPDDTPTDGCSAATNPDELAGKIALIDRGECFFTEKVLNAQAAGAIAAIIVNNAGDSSFTPGGDATLPISIPAVGLGQSDGELIRRAACAKSGLFLNDGRFEVTAEWADGRGQTGDGVPTLLTDDTGYFYFFSPDNVEVVVKVLDACNLSGFNSFWVFAAGLTNVEVTLTVTDTQTNESKVYSNPLGQAFQPIQDTNAFQTCP